jgi:3-isopropylmalate dehydratase small subunit
MALIRGKARLLGDDINTDLHCSSKYHPGRDNAYVAQHAFEQLAPGFASRFAKGDVIVAGRNFGNNSSREQAVHILHLMGVSGIVAASFGRQFFRNCINNGLAGVECSLPGIEEGDGIEIDLAEGRVAVPARGLIREVPPLPAAAREILAAGGLIPFLQAHPDWKTPVTSDQ